MRQVRAHLWEPFASEKGLVAGRCAAPLSGTSYGEKPNPISIPGPWSCGQRTARGFLIQPTVVGQFENNGGLRYRIWTL